MRESKYPRRLSASMRRNRIDDGSSRKLVLTIFLIFFGAVLAVCAFLAYEKLRKVYTEPSLLTDISRQIQVETGPNIQAGTIIEGFGLHIGVNLADVNFPKVREKLLKRIPNIRAITVTRHLPDKITITVEEREPVARLSYIGARAATGKVVDREGVVFVRQPGTELLPVIREKSAPGTRPGEKLTGRARAALDLVQCCSVPPYSELGLLEIDIRPRDFLLATLGNLTRAKITWEDMDEPTSRTAASLKSQITNLTQTFCSPCAVRGTIWNVTLPGKCFADTKEPIL